MSPTPIKKTANITSESDFLANISHEIRTPVNAICGISDLLNNFDLPPEKQKDLIEKLNISARQLKELINDILDFSKLEAGQLTLSKRTFDLFGVLKDVYNICIIKADEKNLKLDVPLTFEGSQQYIGDPTRLKQILLNLMSNAIKFTDEGSVKVSLEKLSDLDHNRVMLRINVEDTGIGIPEDQKEKIFDKFSQGSAGKGHGREGTGLGLTITKHLIEIMEGSISLNTKEDEGSSFIVDLPLEVDHQD
ncbi:MAG: ATP-binding protein [Pseudomonadota bacterium]